MGWLADRAIPVNQLFLRSHPTLGYLVTEETAGMPFIVKGTWIVDRDSLKSTTTGPVKVDNKYALEARIVLSVPVHEYTSDNKLRWLSEEEIIERINSMIPVTEQKRVTGVLWAVAAMIASVFILALIH